MSSSFFVWPRIATRRRAQWLGFMQRRCWVEEFLCYAPLVDEIVLLDDLRTCLDGNLAVLEKAEGLVAVTAGLCSALGRRSV
jgi:hypothetical protein